MSESKKTKWKWAGILTGIGSLVGAVTPLVVALKSDERKIQEDERQMRADQARMKADESRVKSDEQQLHKDESIINDLNSKILAQANIAAESIDNIKQIILDIYKEIYKLSDKTTAASGRVSLVDSAISALDGKVSGLERAINMLIRSNHGHN